jgi:hypothetical protein
MPADRRRSLATRLKWVLTGRPMSAEETRAARAAGQRDPGVRQRFDVPWGRDVGGIS